MKKLFVVMVSLLFIVMAGCSGGGGGSSSMASSDDSMSAKIDSSGGSLTTPNGEAGLDVPAGAISESKTITVSPSKKQTPPGSIAVPYDYTPDGQTFSSPVTICMKYDPASIPEGMSPSDLRIALLSANGEWETTGASTVDTTNYMVCGQTTHFSTYSIVVHERKNFGEQTGDFNSVIAYSNGTTGNTSNINNTYNSYATGMKWQCDEYVNRYYKQVYNQEIRVAGQIANDYYQNASERGLEAYPNDSSEPPQVGDILVSENGDGHLAIVREVQANKIFVIQQNWSNNGADNRYPIARNGNHVFPFDGKKGNYAVKGWLRDTSTPTYSISGTVYGASVAGVTISLAGVATASTTTDASGNYTFTGLAAGSYTVIPAKTGYTFTPSSRNVTVSDENESNINFTSAVNETPTYTISGTVSGAVQSGVTITLTGTGSSTTTTDASGNYTFTGATNGNYSLTASKTGYSFTPTSISAIVNNANVTGKNFTAMANVVPSSAKTITAFSLNGVTGTINETVKTVLVDMPCGTDLTSLVATFVTTGVNVKVGSTIQISGTTTNNFTTSVIYTVTAADASTVNYTVTVDTLLDMTFNASANNSVRWITFQPNGKILIGGAFISAVNGVTRNLIARLNADGTLDTTFDPNVTSATPAAINPHGVERIVLQPDGKIIIGGAFDSVGGVTMNRMARLNSDGTLDTSFIDPNISLNVYPIVLQSDGKILIGGPFTSINGVTRRFIAKLNSDGTLDPTFDPNANEQVVRIIELSDGKILIGGDFTTIGGVTRKGVARLNSDGSLDTTFVDPNVNAGLRGMALQSDGKIVIGGYFTSVGGVSRNHIARLNANGTLDTTFDPNVTGSHLQHNDVQANGKILIGGSFTSVGGVTRNNIARLNSDGSLDMTFDPNANGITFTSAVQANGKIIIVGDFTTICGVIRNHIARMNP